MEKNPIIIASIDKNLSEKELDLYIEELVKAANVLDNNENYNAIYRVIDKNSDDSQGKHIRNSDYSRATMNATNQS